MEFLNDHPAWVLVFPPLLCIYCVAVAGLCGYMYKQARLTVLEEAANWRTSNHYRFTTTPFWLTAALSLVGGGFLFRLLVAPLLAWAFTDPDGRAQASGWISAALIVSGIVFLVVGALCCALTFEYMSRRDERDHTLTALGLPDKDELLLQHGYSAAEIAHMRRQERRKQLDRLKYAQHETPPFAAYVQSLHARVYELEEELLNDPFNEWRWNTSADYRVAERNKLAKAAWAASGLTDVPPDPDWIVVTDKWSRSRGVPPSIANDIDAAPPLSPHSWWGLREWHEALRLRAYNQSAWPRIDRIDEILWDHHDRIEMRRGDASHLPANRWRRRLVAERNRLAKIEWIKDGSIPGELDVWDDITFCAADDDLLDGASTTSGLTDLEQKV